MNFSDNKISVSIIIPVYNVELFIAEAIESVLSQSFAEIELILVNDGSQDDSASICGDYARRDNRIKFLDQENSGVSIARNNGLLHAKGEYIYFMDADDTIDINLIRTSYEVAKQEDSDIVIIGAYYCRRVPRVPALPTCAQMIRLNFLNQYPDIRFPQHIQPCEDGLFSHQLLALTSKIGLNPEGIYHYRQHEHQNHVKINANSWKVIRQIPMWLDILDKFYARYDLCQSHALHLVLFMEHEPFEFRYLGMSLDSEQKIFLFDLIKKKMSEDVLPYLKKEKRKYISKPFLLFLNADSPDHFDKVYARYLNDREIKKKRYLYMTKFIPLKNWRRKLRKGLNDNF